VMDEQKQGAHARRVMESYERWLQGKPELDILRLMGLFDRPAEKGALDALRKEPAIPNLTDALQKLGEANWKFAVNNLRELRLLAPEDPHEPDTLDCHPLLREHFGEKLKAENPNAWREAHNRLYEYYKSAAKELPDTLEEMAPLYAAVIHGCQAGRHQEALIEVFWKRIRRGQESFSWRKLGAFGSDLTALSGFFDGTSWRKPVDGLNEDWKSYILSAAGFCLRALGQLAEAAQPMQMALETDIAQKNWKSSAAASASNLSELYLTIGDMTQAITYAEQSVGLADQSGDELLRLNSRTAFGNAQHQAGHFLESQAAFHEVEDIQKKSQPEFSLLYSWPGFLYCDLLLSQGDYAKVERRASRTLKDHGERYPLLDIALDNLSLGRTYFLNPQRKSKHSLAQSLIYINKAVDGLRQAGQQDELPRGLLARAEYYRVTGDLNKSQKDLDEAFTISTRGRMGLEYARLYLAHSSHLHLRQVQVLRGGALPPKQSPLGESEIASHTVLRSVQGSALAMTEKAREHLKIAKEMIEKMGYHRRDKEVEELEKLLEV
jgi:tetratricopeptide (TPR) repeat protein